MADRAAEHYDILANAIRRMHKQTAAERQELYDHARQWLAETAQKATPPWPLLELVQEQRALEQAIARLEAEYEQPDESKFDPDAVEAEVKRLMERHAPPTVPPDESPFQPPAIHPPERTTIVEEEGRDPWIWIGVVALVLAAIIGLGLLLYRALIPAPPPPAAQAPPVQERAAAKSAPIDAEERMRRAREFLDRGEQRIRAGDYGSAIFEYSEAIRLDPDNAASYNNRAFAYWSVGETDRAIADYSEAIKRDPDNVVALGNRAVAYNFKGEYELAIRDLNEAIRLRPNDPNVRNGRCWGRALAGLLQEALQDCNEALRLKPDDPNVYDSRGLVHLKLGQFDQAIRDYDTALKYDPKLAGSLYGRGIAKLRRGDKRGGEADMAAARAIRPDIAAMFERYGVR